MSSPRIDVSIEHRDVPEPQGRKHPNTCPRCDSHYRDDELDANLWVCPHCGHHFAMKARARIASLADDGSFVEEAADLRSEDPLHFFDLRPYTERLAEAEMKTGLGEAMVIGQAAIDRRACELAVMDFSFMGGSMGSVVGEKFSRACDSAAEAGMPLVAVTSSGGARMQEGILALMQLPTVACAIGEGGWGGAIGIALADRVLMQENAIYSVISPEGCAAILWRDAGEARKAAAAFKPDATHCLELGVIDAIVPEPPDGAHTDPDAAATLLKDSLGEALDELGGFGGDELRGQRRARFRALGALGAVKTP